MSEESSRSVFAEYAEPYWRVMGWPIWLPLLVYRRTRKRPTSLPRMVVVQEQQSAALSTSPERKP